MKNIFLLIFLITNFAFGATKYLQGDTIKSLDLTKTWTLPSATGTLLRSGAVVSSDLSASAGIVSSQIADGTLTSADISASAAIPYSYLSLGSSIISTDLTTNSVTTAKVEDGAITTAKILDATISSADISNAAIASKDIDGGTASNTSRITIPKDAKTNLDALTRKQGTIVYDTTSNKPYYDNGTVLTAVGSGSGGSKNYITGGDAETGISSFVTYADAAGTSPVDGTGGSASATFAVSADTSLADTNLFSLVKGATNRQGDGASYAFSIDGQDQAKVLQISFNYMVASGTFVAGTNSTASDVTVWIYDVTNAAIIQPSSVNLLSNSTTIADKFNATFQTASNSTSYRLIWHIGSTSASAYTLKFDTISVSPSTYVYGTPITDIASYTPTLSDATNATVTKSTVSRNGDRARFQGLITWSGAGGGSTFTVSLGGLVIDTAKISSAVQNTSLGEAYWFDSGTARKGAKVVYNSTTAVAFEEITSSAGALFGTGFAASDTLSYDFEVPIVGWSSSVQMSDQTDTRVVVAYQNYNIPTGTLSAAYNVVKFGSMTQDTHGGYDAATGLYTVKVAGHYRVSSMLEIAKTSYAAGDANLAAVAVNGTGVLYGTAVKSATGVVLPVQVSGIVKVNAGDTISIKSYCSAATGLAFSNTWGGSNFSLERISGPSAIAASESYIEIYKESSGLALGTGVVILQYNTIEKSTHGSITTGAAWKFTAQESGTYSVSGAARISTASRRLDLYKNGAFYRVLSEVGVDVTSPYATDIQLLAGDYIDIRAQSGSAANLYADAKFNYITVKRVGNY